VLLFFMHLKYDKPFNAIVIIISMALVVLPHRDRPVRLGAVRAAADPGLRAVHQDQPAVTGRSGDPRGSRGAELPGAGVWGCGSSSRRSPVLFIAAIVGYLIVRTKDDRLASPGHATPSSGLWLATIVLVGPASRSIARSSPSGAGELRRTTSMADGDPGARIDRSSSFRARTGGV
jgi:hypothetical protein